MIITDFRYNVKTIWTLTEVEDYVNKSGNQLKLHTFTDDKGFKHKFKLRFDFDCPPNTKCGLEVEFFKYKDKQTKEWVHAVEVLSAEPIYEQN